MNRAFITLKSQRKGDLMQRICFYLAVICTLAIACTPLSNLLIPAPTAVPTPTPTPTPAPDPCSAEAMRKLTDEVKSLAERYMEAIKKEESWLPRSLDRFGLTYYSSDGISFRLTSIPLYWLSIPSCLFLRVEMRLIVFVK